MTGAGMNDWGRNEWLGAGTDFGVGFVSAAGARSWGLAVRYGYSLETLERALSKEGVAGARGRGNPLRKTETKNRGIGTACVRASGPRPAGGAHRTARPGAPKLDTTLGRMRKTKSFRSWRFIGGFAGWGPGWAHQIISGRSVLSNAPGGRFYLG